MTAPVRAIRLEEIDAIPFFGALDDAARELLRRVARVEAPGDGACVQFADGAMSRLIVVLTGGLRVVHARRDGHAQVVRLLGRGEYLGDTGFVLSRSPSHSAYALPGTTLCALGYEDLAELIAACPGLVLTMLETATERLLDTEVLLSSIVADDVRARVAAYLLRLPGPTGADGRRRVRLPNAQVDVASVLGTTPETLSRRIRALVDSGAVERVAPGTFELDVGALRAQLGP